MTQVSRRFIHLDFLRALAALFVVYQHTSEIAVKLVSDTTGWEYHTIQFFIHTLGIGEIGVVLFFLISGFVIPFSLTPNVKHPIRRFAIHRFFRLYPAYWLSVGLGVLLVRWRFGAGDTNIEWSQVLLNLTMLQAYFGVENVLGSYWTLSLELFFYGLCALLFFLRKFHSACAILFVFIALVMMREIARHVPTSSPFTWNVFFYLRYLGFMFTGLFFHRYFVEKDRQMLKWASWMFLLTFVLMSGKSTLEIFRGDWSVLKAPLNYLIALALFLLSFKFKPDMKFGTFLGKISYSIYLFHPVIFYPLYFYIWTTLSPSTLNHPHLFIFASVALTVLFSAASFHWIERPALAFGKKWEGFKWLCRINFNRGH